MNHPLPSTELLTRLYLGAVLPSLTQLVEVDPKASSLLGTRPWHVQLRTPLEDYANVSFNGQTLQMHPSTGPAPLVLRFHSREHLIETFRETNRLPPLPVRGFSQLFRVGRFTALIGRLAEAMNPAKNTADCRTRLLFGGLLTRALAILCTHQSSAAKRLQSYEQFICQLSVADDVGSWFGKTKAGFMAGRGTPESPSNLHIQFSDLSTAKDAAIGQLDQLAAVGSGRLTVAGLPPLAHDIEVLLDRIDVYLR